MDFLIGASAAYAMGLGSIGFIYLHLKMIALIKTNSARQLLWRGITAINVVLWFIGGLGIPAALLGQFRGKLSGSFLMSFTLVFAFMLCVNFFVIRFSSKETAER